MRNLKKRVCVAAGGAILVFLFARLLIPKIGDDVVLSRAREDLEEISSRLEEYRKNTGSYPTTEEGLNALVSRPPGQAKDGSWRRVLPKVPPDPWMNDYRYRLHGSGDAAKFEVWSPGKDGEAGTRDDISSLDT